MSDFWVIEFNFVVERFLLDKTAGLAWPWYAVLRGLTAAKVACRGGPCRAAQRLDARMPVSQPCHAVPRPPAPTHPVPCRHSGPTCNQPLAYKSPHRMSDLRPKRKEGDGLLQVSEKEKLKNLQMHWPE